MVPTEAAAAFLEPGRSAWIAAGGSLLWRSAAPVPGRLPEPDTPGHTREGVVSVDGAGGVREVYRSVETVPHRLARLVAHGSGHSPDDPAKSRYYTYPLSYHVQLDYAPYRREITGFRIDLIGVAAVATLLLFVATRAAVHHPMRPLVRVTRDVGCLSGGVGETVDRSRHDPEEVRVLAERINWFLVALDEIRNWELQVGFRGRQGRAAAQCRAHARHTDQASRHHRLPAPDGPGSGDRHRPCRRAVQDLHVPSIRRPGLRHRGHGHRASRSASLRTTSPR